MDELDVPIELRSVPGIERDRSEERFFAWAFPEPDFDDTPPGAAHKILAPHFNEAYQRMQERFATLVKEQLAKTKDFHLLPPTGEPAGDDITADIRQRADEIGIQLVGVTRFDRMHVYSNYKKRVHFKNVIITGIEESSDSNDLIPGEDALNMIIECRLEIGNMTLELAEFIRDRGYAVQFLAGPLGLDLVKVLPYALEAGLGQMGANGQLLSPYFGSRWKPVAISTDAPLTRDQPQDFGIPMLCEKCQVCVRRCPGRALSKQRVTWRGVKKFKAIPERCIPMVERYDACGICIKVCPVQRYGLPAVLDHYSETGKILGKGTDELEAYTLPDRGRFGVGEMPRFTKDESRIRYDLLAEVDEGEKGLFGLDWGSSGEND